VTNQEAAQLVAICVSMWPKHPVPNAEGLVKGWEMALSGIGYQDAEHALATYLQTGTFFPAPAEIRALCRTATAIPAGTENAEMPRMIYRIWCEAADDYLELDAAVPYDPALHGLEANQRRYRGDVLPGDPTPETHRTRAKVERRSERTATRPLVELVQG
jgi:hypothetical protein